jgi:hypothetical protein
LVAAGGTSVAVGVVLTLATNTFFAFRRTRVAYGGYGVLSRSTRAADFGRGICGKKKGRRREEEGKKKGRRREEEGKTTTRRVSIIHHHHPQPTTHLFGLVPWRLGLAPKDNTRKGPMG